MAGTTLTESHRGHGGPLVERFAKLPVHGGTPGLRYRIDVANVNR